MYKNGLRANPVPEAESQHFNFTAIVSIHIKRAGVESNHVPAPRLYDCTVHISKQPFCRQVSLTTHFKPIQFQWCQKRSSMAVYCGFISHSRGKYLCGGNNLDFSEPVQCVIVHFSYF